MQKLITHINPHLDDIFAIWLFKKFHPDFKSSPVEFISARHDMTDDSDDQVVFFGTGGGKYDEHKEGVEECAGSLVWNEILNQGLVKQEIEKASFQELSDWNKQIDMGKAPASEIGPFSVQAFLRPLDSKPESSQKAYQLGSEILDRILEVLRRNNMAKKDWEQRVEFESKFGKSYAVKSEFVDRSFCKQVGGDLFLMYDPKYSSVQYFTPSHTIDLEPIYQKVKSLDPEADWFLHQSHHMVICGSGSAPDSKKTKLAFDELIEATKSYS